MPNKKQKATATIIKVPRPQLPECVHIGSIPFMIAKVDKLNPSEAVGQVNYPNQEIEIKKDMGEQFECETLIHEITHAVLYSVGEEAFSNDESFVQRVSSAFASVLTRNKSLLKYLILVSDSPGWGYTRDHK